MKISMERHYNRFKAIEDELIDLRDRGISQLGAPNGLVVSYKDGTPSDAVRMRIPEVLLIADETDEAEGIYRVKFDEALEDRVALTLFQIDHHAGTKPWPTEEDLAKGRSIFDPPPSLEEFKREYLEQARTVLAAIKGSNDTELPES